MLRKTRVLKSWEASFVGFEELSNSSGASSKSTNVEFQSEVSPLSVSLKPQKEENSFPFTDNSADGVISSHLSFETSAGPESHEAKRKLSQFFSDDRMDCQTTQYLKRDCILKSPVNAKSVVMRQTRSPNLDDFLLNILQNYGSINSDGEPCCKPGSIEKSAENDIVNGGISRCSENDCCHTAIGSNAIDVDKFLQTILAEDQEIPSNGISILSQSSKQKVRTVCSDLYPASGELKGALNLSMHHHLSNELFSQQLTGSQYSLSNSPVTQTKEELTQSQGIEIINTKEEGLSQPAHELPLCSQFIMENSDTPSESVDIESHLTFSSNSTALTSPVICSKVTDIQHNQACFKGKLLNTKRFIRGGLAETLYKVIKREDSDYAICRHNHTVDPTLLCSAPEMLDLMIIQSPFSLPLKCRIVNHTAEQEDVYLICTRLLQDTSKPSIGDVITVFSPWKTVAHPSLGKVIVTSSYCRVTACNLSQASDQRKERLVGMKSCPCSRNDICKQYPLYKGPMAFL